MDELFIFNKSLSSYELKNLYNTYNIDEKLSDDAEKVEHLVYNDISTKIKIKLKI